MPLKISSYKELAAYVGKPLGISPYLTIDQDRIDKFAEATLDHQWIHTDPERAAQESDFGSTIAHGYLTLSLAPYFLGQILELSNIKMGVNYGLDALRFINPVKVGSRLRMHADLAELKDLRGTARAKINVNFEIEGELKPACVAEVTYLYQFG
jgi:acyl dehydratase